MRFEIGGFSDHRRLRAEDVRPYVFFFDFDNTITAFDVLDDLIATFAINDDWKTLEKDWQDGKIGSRSCLEGQLGCLRAERTKLLKYLALIRIDPYFKKLLAFLRRRKIEASIVSDSFSFFIREILKNNGIHHSQIAIYANDLTLANGRLLPSFPYGNDDCPDCAHCKRRHILDSRNHVKKVVYVGDGRSDFCAAMEADMVFAKGALLEYLREKGKPCVGFDHFQSIYTFVKAWLNPKQKAPLLSGA